MAAAPVTSKPQAQPESAPEKQKQAHSSNASNASKADAAQVTANSLDNLDNPQFKELQRSLRNALKKLNATVKVDAIIAENPGKSLDELVAEKKINNDQKAQALKKPSLQAAVTQIEEQISHFKEFAAHYEDRLASQKTDLEKAHKEELNALREKSVAEAAEASKKEFEKRLLTLSKFLCAAAAMRRSGDETSNESRGFEGVLYQVYGGSLEAVGFMSKLIDGVDEKIVGVEGEALDITYGKVKQISEGYAPTSEEVTTEAAPASDPTLANAGYTELQDSTLAAADPAASQQPTAAAEATQSEQVPPPAQTLVSDAANPVAEATWISNADASHPSSATAEGWVEVPRDPAETDTGLQATPAAVETDLKNNSIPAQTSENGQVRKEGVDGFEPVVHHQRQPSGRGRGGGGRGRGRGEFRGRGRGDFRGRGRGGRGGRGRGGPNGAPAAATPAAGTQ
ncbi:hypothetical protein ASPWEDRAFT_172497 [Aspergillus wentii DTO 134E9]|uniref:YAG7-like dimerisation domain-containing protein n=1 Tax=Aspergillus wentii DTO 134E9 TaxID=1073089 RepID=A0A1L9RLH3_ASPWE|nr:uncharacterized protein ASPWEDRAFT_172497 [Aspergillus wentii DTO 134E9]KAI9924536.1 hypothetical protein MW887_006808 [Aspergillus wentii]OJJ35697.1 hypothetical protein ASPWEDRAFT_172497 [Aspergillus wentii DTO 134E9]